MRQLVILALISLSVNITVSSAIDCVDYRDYLHRVGTVESDGRSDQVVLVDEYAIVSVVSGLRVFNTANPRSMVQVGGFDWESFIVNTMEAEAEFLYVAGTDYISGRNHVLCVFDITDISHPALVKNIEINDFPHALVIANDFLFLTFRDRLFIYDLSNPEEPQLVTEYYEHCGYSLEGILVEGDRAYLTNASPRLTILDVSDPTQPQYLGGVTVTSGYFRDVCLKGDYLYVASGNDGITVFDVSDPQAPVVAASVQTMYSPCYNVGVSGDHVFASTAGDTRSGLWVIDASDGARPNLVNHIALSSHPRDFDFRGDHAFVVTSSSNSYGDAFLEAVDIAVPESVPGGEDWNMGSGSSLTVAYREPFVIWGGSTQGQPILRSARLSCSSTNPQPAGQLDIMGSAYETAFIGDYIYVSTRYEIAGIHIVKMTATGQLQDTGQIDFGEAVYSAGDIAIRGDFAYVATEPDGVYILDVSEPGAPVKIGGFGQGKAVTALKSVGNCLYLSVGVTSGMGEIEIWKIVDPLQPQLLGSYDVGQHISDLDVCGRKVYACSENALLTVDFSNPASPQLLSVVPGVGWRVAVGDGVAHLASLHGMTLIDIRNASAPKLMGNFRYGGVDIEMADDTLFMSGINGLALAPRQCPKTIRLEMPIDVRPWSDRNSINCSQSGGLIPVAILTTADYDALDVDHTTVRFGPDGAAESHSNRNGPARHEEDVDGDGDLDLLFHFPLSDTGIQCGDTEVALTGETFDCISVIGTDAIQTVGKGNKEPWTSRIIQITPNPFNPQTKISFYADQPQRVRVAVYDIRGRRIAELTNQQYQVGEHSVEWRGRDSAGRAVPSGEYFFRIEIGNQVETRKAMLLR